MRKYVFLALFLIIPLTRGALLAAGQLDAWSEAQLDKSYAAKFINNSLCSKSAEWTRACRKGIGNDSVTDFDGWLEKLEERLDAKVKSKTYGAIVNEYLSAFDPHAKIIPMGILNQQLGESAHGADGSIQDVAGRPVAVLKIKVFHLGVCEKAERELDQLMTQKPLGVILDLRNNGGGRNEEARCVYRLFSPQPLPLERKVLAHTLLPEELGLRPAHFPPKFADDELIKEPRFPKIPLVVLINAQSASVTEMIAAGLQDTKRAWLVGEQTFGKGTFQLNQPLHFHDGLRLVHSVFEMVRDRGIPIQYEGVTPNFLAAAQNSQKILREVDLFPPTEKIHHLTWTENRVSRKIRIQKCLGKPAPPPGGDSQRDLAAAVLLCDSKN